MKTLETVEALRTIVVALIMLNVLSIATTFVAVSLARFRSTRPLTPLDETLDRVAKRIG